MGGGEAGKISQEVSAEPDLCALMGNQVEDTEVRAMGHRALGRSPARAPLKRRTFRWIVLSKQLMCVYSAAAIWITCFKRAAW